MRRVRAVASAGLTHDQLQPHVVADYARLGRGGGEVDYATYDALGRYGARQTSAGIERFQACVRAFQAMKEPPRHAVHGGHDRRVLAKERSDRLGDAGQALRLDGDEDVILWAQLRRVAFARTRKDCVLPLLRTRRPSRWIASSWAPRAITETSWPARDSHAAIRPPIAPAP